MRTTEYVPPELFLFVKLAAATGLFIIEIFLVGLTYKLFKKLFGEEKARKYRKYFLYISIPLFLFDIYLFFFFFH